MEIEKKRGRPKGSTNKSKTPPIVKKLGRPKGSKNKSKPHIQEVEPSIKIEPSIVEEQPPIIKKRGRPVGSENKKNFVPTDTDEMTLDMPTIWSHMNTGSKKYINLTQNYELHKEDIPIFASDYIKTHKNAPKYVVINPRNSHLIPYIKQEFSEIE